MGGLRAVRWVGISLAFAAGFLAACAVLSRLVPPTPIGGARIEWVREHAADYDTLFVGSSRSFRQVMPERGRPHAALDPDGDGFEPRPAGRAKLHRLPVPSPHPAPV